MEDALKGGRPLFSGWVKRSSGKLLRRYRECYLQVEETELLVYKNQDLQTCLERVDLEKYDKCLELRSPFKKKNRLVLIRAPKSASKVHDMKLQVQNAEQKQAWIKALGDAINRAKNKIFDEVRVDESCSLDHVTRSRPRGNHGRRPPTRKHMKEVASSSSDGILRLDLDMVAQTPNGTHGVSEVSGMNTDPTPASELGPSLQEAPPPSQEAPPPSQEVPPPMPPSKRSTPRVPWEEARPMEPASDSVSEPSPQDPSDSAPSPPPPPTHPTAPTPPIHAVEQNLPEHLGPEDHEEAGPSPSDMPITLPEDTPTSEQQGPSPPAPPKKKCLKLPAVSDQSCDRREGSEVNPGSTGTVTPGDGVSGRAGPELANENAAGQSQEAGSRPCTEQEERKSVDSGQRSHEGSDRCPSLEGEVCERDRPAPIPERDGSRPEELQNTQELLRGWGSSDGGEASVGASPEELQNTQELLRGRGSSGGGGASVGVSPEELLMKAAEKLHLAELCLREASALHLCEAPSKDRRTSW
ncbi:hypothetical protein AAFF_G00068340 [Aldrovandia affinis]|uniref:PH domain-containing protein n=1 Tax=Aldrovandia affinis TaxID=143900 RepID=A0AAD7RZC0_9TELE|nr:hypothetical protein AAFF_G00068340 [Aldrovandia affinis]